METVLTVIEYGLYGIFILAVILGSLVIICNPGKGNWIN